MGEGIQGAMAHHHSNVRKLTTLGPSTSLLKGNLAKIIVIMVLGGCGYFIVYFVCKTVNPQLSPHLPYKEG